MIANYGYKDGSGEYFITIETDKCDGCGACVGACPYGVFETGEDANDPLRDEPVASVTDAQRRKLKYTCAQCKPAKGYDISALSCVTACPTGAISHSW